eukprot:g3900.t1
MPTTSQLIAAFRMMDDHATSQFLEDATAWFEGGDDAASLSSKLGWPVSEAAARVERTSGAKGMRARVVLCRDVLRGALYAQLIEHRAGLDLHETNRRLLLPAARNRTSFPETGPRVLHPHRRYQRLVHVLTMLSTKSFGLGRLRELSRRNGTAEEESGYHTWLGTLTRLLVLVTEPGMPKRLGKVWDPVASADDILFGTSGGGSSSSSSSSSSNNSGSNEAGAASGGGGGGDGSVGRQKSVLGSKLEGGDVPCSTAAIVDHLLLDRVGWAVADVALRALIKSNGIRAAAGEDYSRKACWQPKRPWFKEDRREQLKLRAGVEMAMALLAQARRIHLCAESPHCLLHHMVRLRLPAMVGRCLREHKPVLCPAAAAAAAAAVQPAVLAFHDLTTASRVVFQQGGVLRGDFLGHETLEPMVLADWPRYRPLFLPPPRPGKSDGKSKRSKGSKSDDDDDTARETVSREALVGHAHYATHGLASTIRVAAQVCPDAYPHYRLSRGTDLLSDTAPCGRVGDGDLAMCRDLGLGAPTLLHALAKINTASAHAAIEELLAPLRDPGGIEDGDGRAEEGTKDDDDEAREREKVIAELREGHKHQHRDRAQNDDEGTLPLYVFEPIRSATFLKDFAAELPRPFQHWGEALLRGGRPNKKTKKKSSSTKESDHEEDDERSQFTADGVPLAQLYVGQRGSGSPVHMHFAAINHLVYGAKLWHIFRPSSTRASRIPAAPPGTVSWEKSLILEEEAEEEKGREYVSSTVL